MFSSKTKKILFSLFILLGINFIQEIKAMNIVLRFAIQKTLLKIIPMITSRILFDERINIKKILLFGKKLKQQTGSSQHSYEMSVQEIRRMLDGPIWDNINQELDKAFHKYLEEKEKINKNIENLPVEAFTSNLQEIEQEIPESLADFVQISTTDMPVNTIQSSSVVLPEVDNKAINREIGKAMFEGCKHSFSNPISHGAEYYQRLRYEQFEGEEKINKVFSQSFMLGMAIGSWCKQITKEIQQEDLEFQAFEDELQSNVILKEVYQEAVAEIKSNLEVLANNTIPEERIAALIVLNKIHIPGRLGFELSKFIKKINSFYVYKNGNIRINKRDDTSARKLINAFNQQMPKSGSFMRFVSKIEAIKYLKSKILNDVDQSIVNSNDYNKVFFDVIRLLSSDNSNQIKATKEAYKLMYEYDLHKPSSQSTILYNYVLSERRPMPLNAYGMPKIFEKDPQYYTTIEAYKNKKLSYDEAWNFLFERYEQKRNIYAALHFESPSIEVEQIIYKLVNHKNNYSYMLDILKNYILKNPSSLKQATYEQFFTEQGILKALVSRSSLYPKLQELPNCLHSAEIVDCLNRFLLLEQNVTIKPIIEKGINYLIFALKTKNTNYLNLSRFYLQNIKNARSCKTLKDFPNFIRLYETTKQNLAHQELLLHLISSIDKLNLKVRITIF